MPQRFLSIKNFEKYQHYKDRNPPWIKLHRSVLTDYQFWCLPDSTKAHLMLLWLVASQNDNALPPDGEVLSRMIGAQIPVDINLLLKAGFLIKTTAKHARIQWASRYVSKAQRQRILDRDGHQCKTCGTIESVENWLEIDHIIPISKGGDGQDENLQSLCKSCNRKKHNDETDARQKLDRCSPSQRRVRGETEESRGAPVNGHPKPKKLRTPLPDGFHWTEKHQLIAQGFGLNVAAECVKFKDKALAKGYLYVDWEAAFRNWLSNAAEYKAERMAR